VKNWHFVYIVGEQSITYQYILFTIFEMLSDFGFRLDQMVWHTENVRPSLVTPRYTGIIYMYIIIIVNKKIVQPNNHHGSSVVAVFVTTSVCNQLRWTD
jgi:hypothetical protein